MRGCECNLGGSWGQGLRATVPSEAVREGVTAPVPSCQGQTRPPAELDAPCACDTGRPRPRVVELAVLSPFTMGQMGGHRLSRVTSLGSLPRDTGHAGLMVH